jgi:hypothetical protein
MTKDEALKMAIEHIEFEGVRNEEGLYVLNACKEALEQPAWRPISLDEMQELHEEFCVRANVIFAIEDILKEKNNG